jgi:hypothetical protein
MPREITISLPDDLAQQADSYGLLEPQAFEQFLRDEVRRRAGDRLMEMMQRLSDANTEPPMSMDEIQAEVDAVRAERRAKRARSA